MTSLVLRVRCPRCRCTRKTASLKRVVCFNCGKNFSIYNKREGKSNIVGIVEGDYILLMKKLYQKKIYERRLLKHT